MKHISKMARVQRVLALAPGPKAIGYAIFLTPKTPFDWGVKRLITTRNGECLKKARALLDWYHPEVLVLENYAGEGSRRSRRVERLISAIAKLAEERDIRLAGYSRGVIRQAFKEAGASTKQEIAEAIGRAVPTLARRVPEKRKIWMSEPQAMCLFDAAALALTFFHLNQNSVHYQ